MENVLRPMFSGLAVVAKGANAFELHGPCARNQRVWTALYGGAGVVGWFASFEPGKSRARGISFAERADAGLELLVRRSRCIDRRKRIGEVGCDLGKFERQGIERPT